MTHVEALRIILAPLSKYGDLCDCGICGCSVIDGEPTACPDTLPWFCTPELYAARGMGSEALRARMVGVLGEEYSERQTSAMFALIFRRAGE